MAADEHHEDHGHTVAAWFLTVSWIVVWFAAGVPILFGGDVVLLTALGLGGSVVCAAIAGILKKAGLGRVHPRPAPPTRQEWEALQAEERQRSKAAEDRASATAAEEEAASAR